jgi:hypothetical protein
MKLDIFILITVLTTFNVNATLISNNGYTFNTESNIISNGTLDWLNFNELSHLDRFEVEALLKNGQPLSGWRYASFNETHDLLSSFFPFFDESNTVQYSSSNNWLSGFRNISYIDLSLAENLITDELKTFGSMFGALIEHPNNYESFVQFQFGDIKSGYGDIGGGFIANYEIVQRASIFDGQIDWLSWEDNIWIGDLELTDINGDRIQGLNKAHGLVRDSVSVIEPTTVSILTLGLLSLATRRNKLLSKELVNHSKFYRKIRGIIRIK